MMSNRLIVLLVVWACVALYLWRPGAADAGAVGQVAAPVVTQTEASSGQCSAPPAALWAQLNVLQRAMIGLACAERATR